MLKIFSLTVTPFMQNARVIACSETSEAVVVDPGGESGRIQNLLKEEGLRCKQIWLTHSHLDHCGGVKQLKEWTGAKLVAHPGERVMRAGVRELCRMYGIDDDDMQDCPEPDQTIEGGEVVSLASHRFRVIFTPGHSPGHVAFYNSENGVILSGDVLFAGAIGRTDLPGGDYRRLMQSIRELLEALPPETKVLCGHGPDTTLQQESQTNPFILGELR